MQLRRLFFALTLLLIVQFSAFSQNPCPPFWNDIQRFKKLDSATSPAQNAILLIGSSSFTNWKDVQAYFPGYNIINRGFGGSQLTDLTRYFYEIVTPYAPKQVIIYCGENDLSSSATMEPETVVNRFKTLFGMIRQNYPQATIHYISMKPSPSRVAFLDKFKKANNDISVYLKGQKNAGFIDVYGAMLDKSGNVRTDIFVEDKLHMNAEGYRIWQKVMQPYLKK
ncbi:MAG: G-D-S-L family lipolytic protein [Chitinophagaceae bacterium]|nr:MAG: G-D-S-L family lipolytic protein [Chitinophagaceae bacterium]